jgi:sulfate/thiosulfate transport system permease protein
VASAARPTPVEGTSSVPVPDLHVDEIHPRPRPATLDVPVVTKASPRTAPVAGAATRRQAPWTLARVILLTLVVLYMGVVLVMPIAALAWEALHEGIGTIIGGLSAPAALAALRQTLWLTAIAVVLNGVFGIAAGLVLVRHRFRGLAILDATIDLVLAVSPIMIGLAFLLLVGRTGWLAPILASLGLKVAFAFPGLVVATLFVTLPFTVREVSHVLAEVGEDEEQVAATLGAGQWRTFWRVTLPNIRRGLTLGLTLTAARALGEFGAVLVLGGAISGRTETATTFIYGAIEERSDAAAYGMAIVLALVSMGFLITLEHLRKKSTRA